MIKVEGNFSFPVYIAEAGDKEDFKPEQIEENCAAIISQDGFLVKLSSKFGTSVRKRDKLSIFGEIKETYIEIPFPKIPKHLFLSIEGFLASVYEKRKTEAAVILCYNETTKKWAYIIPFQKVTGATVDYKIDEKTVLIHEDTLKEKSKGIVPREWKRIGSIHSHAAMSAFHSGTDNADEFNFDGYHITIGSFSSPFHSYSSSVVFGGKRIKKELWDLVDGIVPEMVFPEGLVEEQLAKPEPVVTKYTGVTSGTSVNGVASGKKNGYTDANGIFHSWDKFHKKNSQNAKPKANGNVVSVKKLKTWQDEAIESQKMIKDKEIGAIVLI